MLLLRLLRLLEMLERAGSRGNVDNMLMRMSELLLSIPTILGERRKVLVAAWTWRKKRFLLDRHHNIIMYSH